MRQQLAPPGLLQCLISPSHPRQDAIRRRHLAPRLARSKTDFCALIGRYERQRLRQRVATRQSHTQKRKLLNTLFLQEVESLCGTGLPRGEGLCERKDGNCKQTALQKKKMVGGVRCAQSVALLVKLLACGFMIFVSCYPWKEGKKK